MDNKTFSINLEKRTKRFAIDIIRCSESLPKTIEYNVIRKQVSRSGSSIGANYREANRSRSVAEFQHKIKICESEANETIYWLEIIEELLPESEITYRKCLSEASELLAIFTSIGNNIRKKGKE